MSSLSEDIPGPLRAIALTLGLPEALVDSEWERHCDWCAERAMKPGSPVWDRFVKARVADLAERLDKGELAARIAQRKRQQAEDAKRAADAEYARQAMSFDAWLAYLAARRRDGLPLEPHEDALARAGPRSALFDAGEWLLHVAKQDAEAERAPF